MSAQNRQIMEKLLESAGIRINGDDPWDIQVHNNQVYERVFSGGALAAGDSYMDGWWDCQALDQFFDRVFRAKLEKKIKTNWRIIWHLLRARLCNLQKKSRAYQVGVQHYDVGNALYQAMLDKRMNYTSGYWKNATDLDSAQEAKLDLVCRKIGLTPGMTVLELGCGWGCFAGYAAEKYGVSVTGVTVSREQVELGKRLCKGLPVDIQLEDYRNVRGKFDRVISIGIMEHVGYKNYRCYMKKVDETLKDEGIAFIHTIGGNASMLIGNPWTTKYIFPNGMFPSIAQLGKAMEGLFVMEDWHNFGPDYDKTLMAWHERFEKSWPRFKDQYGERFHRMWRFYLLSSAAVFRSRRAQLWQIVMTKPARMQPDCRHV